MKVAPGVRRPGLIDGYAPTEPISPPVSRAPPAEPDSFGQVLRRLAKEVDRGEKVVSQALRADPSGDDSRSMIALQAGVYRYVEAVDLCTRLVDRAAGAVRTTLQSQ